MPLLYYWSKKNQLRDASGKLIESSVFDSFKIKNLAPLNERRYVANFWWIKKHSAFSWHDDRGWEKTIFVPGLIPWREALILAREEMKDFVPSAIVFRIHNPDGPYLYD
jgi:hypothetical protein